MHEPPDHDRFSNNLPWYVNGRLDRVERDWMEDYLRQHPEAEHALRCERLLRNSLQEGEVAYDGRLGLPEFLRRIRPETSLGRVQRWLERFGLRAGSPAVAVFASLLVVQLATIGALFSRGDHSAVTPAETWRSAGSTATTGPVLRITFKPETEERQIRLLLVRIDGIIVAGPGQLGNYIVKVPAESIDAAQNQLAAEAFVESVEKLRELPTPD